MFTLLVFSVNTTGVFSLPTGRMEREAESMFVEMMRHLLWRRRVKAAHAWRDAERAEYLRAVQRITALSATGHGGIGRPRS